MPILPSQLNNRGPGEL